MLWEPRWSVQQKFEHACRYRWDVEIYKLAPKTDDISLGLLRILDYDRNGNRRINAAKYEKADLNLIENLAKMAPNTINWLSGLGVILKVFVINDDSKRLQHFIKHMLTRFDDESFMPTYYGNKNSAQYKTRYFQTVLECAVRYDKLEIIKMLLTEFGNIIDPIKGTVFDRIDYINIDGILVDGPSDKMQQFINEYTFSLDSINYNKNIL